MNKFTQSDDYRREELIHIIEHSVEKLANGTPYYTEASMVIECKIMYAAPFDPQYFKSDAPKKMYARSAEGRSQGENFPAGIHTMYIGEVINAWKKE